MSESLAAAAAAAAASIGHQLYAIPTYKEGPGLLEQQELANQGLTLQSRLALNSH